MATMADLPLLKRWHTREDSGIRLDRELRWWHDGEAVEHLKIVEAFNTGLSPTDDGRFRLEVGNDWCFVSVEDSAYAVLAIDVVEADIWLRLSHRTGEKLDPSTLSIDASGVLFCRVMERRAKARFGRDAQFELGSLLEPSPAGTRLRVGSLLIDLPDLAWPRE